MILYLLGLLTFILKRKHLLLLLISLEFFVIIFLILVRKIIYINEINFILKMFLIIRVGEGVLGLSILVNLIRLIRIDYLRSINFIW